MLISAALEATGRLIVQTAQNIRTLANTFTFSSTKHRQSTSLETMRSQSLFLIVTAADSAIHSLLSMMQPGPNPPSVNVTRVKSPPSDVTSHKSRPHHALPALELNFAYNMHYFFRRYLNNNCMFGLCCDPRNYKGR